MTSFMLRLATCATAGAFVAAPTSAQLADLQPGRNFPTAAPDFGTGRSENIDVGDIDNDGDWDVGIANGGDGSPQANRIYVNQGGLQGGMQENIEDARPNLDTRGDTRNVLGKRERVRGGFGHQKIPKASFLSHLCVVRRPLNSVTSSSEQQHSGCLHNSPLMEL